MFDHRIRYAHACRLFTAAIVLTLSGPGISSAHMAAPAATTETPAATDSGLITQIRRLRAQGNWTRALALCESALQRHPDNRNLLLQRIFILADAGASVRAQHLARQLSPPASLQLLARLEADVAARQVRRARYTPEPLTASPYAMDDVAAAQLKAIEKHYQDSARKVATRARLDRLIALQNGERDAEVARGYDAMTPAQRKALPHYVVMPMADSLLRLRRPEEAAALLQRDYKLGAPIAQGATDPAVILSYALSESGHYQHARNIIDRATAAQPIWRHVSNQAAAKPNPHRSNDALNAAMLRAYNHLLSTAWTRLHDGVNEAPNNVPWRRELGNVERQRGWPRMAEQDLYIAHNLNARDIHVPLALIDTWRDLGDFTRIEPALQPLEHRYTRSKHVHRERLAWDRQRGWQLDAEQGFGHGYAPDFGNHDNYTRIELAAPLFAHHWRVYGLARRAHAALPEGPATRSELGAGLRGQWRGLLAYVQALPSLDHFSAKTAIETGFDWGLTDHWSWQADASTSSTDTPLRGRYYDITGRGVRSRLQWRSSERLRAGIDVGAYNLSDGNHRRTYGADIIGRVLTRPRLRIDLGGAVDRSSNSLLDQPYYDPMRDRSMAVNVHIEHTLIERYERNWQQVLDVSVGSYSEHGYSSDWLVGLVYSQRFAPHNGLRFGWQLGWNSQPYDGQRESRVTLALNMHWGE